MGVVTQAKAEQGGHPQAPPPLRKKSEKKFENPGVSMEPTSPAWPNFWPRRLPFAAPISRWRDRANLIQLFPFRHDASVVRIGRLVDGNQLRCKS
jgi:hypothetical protein